MVTGQRMHLPRSQTAPQLRSLLKPSRQKRRTGRHRRPIRERVSYVLSKDVGAAWLARGWLHSRLNVLTESYVPLRLVEFRISYEVAFRAHVECRRSKDRDRRPHHSQHPHSQRLHVIAAREAATEKRALPRNCHAAALPRLPLPPAAVRPPFLQQVQFQQVQEQ